MKFFSKSRQRKALKKPVGIDHWYPFALLSIIAFGLVMVASASIVISERQYGHAFYYLTRQVIYLGLGTILGYIVYRLPIDFWKQWGTGLLFMSFILLVAVLIPGIGREVNGSSRWIGFGPIGIQVSEFAKLAFIIFLAGYLERHEDEVRHEIKGFLKPMALLGVVAILLLKEPDFGATVVISTTALGMMFLAGVRLRYFIILVSFVLVAFAILAISSPYRLERMTTFLNPWAVQYNSGYQLTQSLIAFGRGGITGVGLGESVQKLFYLPEAHTDFLFAVLAEELGLLGILVVMSLYAILVGRGLVIGHRAQRGEHAFAAYIAYGVSFWLGMQAMVNMGVDAGVLPTKGLTLPLMSYGGSSLLIVCVAVALVLRVDRESRQRAAF